VLLVCCGSQTGSCSVAVAACCRALCTAAVARLPICLSADATCGVEPPPVGRCMCACVCVAQHTTYGPACLGVTRFRCTCYSGSRVLGCPATCWRGVLGFLAPNTLERRARLARRRPPVVACVACLCGQAGGRGCCAAGLAFLDGTARGGWASCLGHGMTAAFAWRAMRNTGVGRWADAPTE
jgi:hypothetical protein